MVGWLGPDVFVVPKIVPVSVPGGGAADFLAFVPPPPPASFFANLAIDVMLLVPLDS